MGQPKLAFSMIAVFLMSSVAQAEIAPRAIMAGAGIVSISTYSASYEPTTSNVAASIVGVDVALHGRWSLNMNALMTMDESLTGYALGGKLAFGSRRTVETGGNDGIIQYTTIHVPRWHFDLFAGIAQYKFSRGLTSTNKNIQPQFRTNPVNANLVGFSFAPSVIFATSENWGIQTTYSFNYGSAGGFSMVSHGLMMAANYSF